MLAVRPSTRTKVTCPSVAVKGALPVQRSIVFWVEVRDSEGRDAGRIVQQILRRNEMTFAFLGANGQFLGDLQTDNWVAWDLRIMDSHARQVATITRDWVGLDPTKFASPDDYVVRISGTVHEPLRTLVVACALSLEIVIRPDTSGV